ncbi:alpha/beta fold hydrolase [Dongia deserti]|uniref:alpha/beta fold hydrolase n=1 Tax=Dongia deserti TaxID=2268030 RepID=UPI0013C400A6|nr:alpha/beta fold hydrolase [Dongia deserti]
MAGIRVQVLGGFSALRQDGSTIALSTRKAEALLAVLVCRPGEAQPRERVANLLWGDRGDRQARHSLSQTLTSIRCALGDAPDPLVAERETLCIDPDVVRADVVELAALAERDDLDSLRKAVKLCRGPLLDGFRLHEAAFDEWLSQERSRFHHIGLAVLTRLAEREAAEGNVAAAISTLERALALDPLSEECHRRLMRIHLDRGNYNAVIRHYRQCTELLKRELGTIPEPATTALYAEARTRLKEAPQSVTEASPAPPPAEERQDIRFCVTTDGVRIAFATAGEGPPLVKTANWLNHLEFDWQSPVWRHLLHGLTGDFRLIRYDERGNGLSDWKVDDFSIEALVCDLETVVDAAGLDRFPLLGISQGCAVAISYAVRHPERVTRMVLHGGYAKGWRARGNPSEIARREAMLTLVREGWGQDNPAFRQIFASWYIPEGSLEQWRWWNDLQRISTSPENAARLMTDLGNIDVTHLLPQVTMPTLVLHSRNDAAVPFEAGRVLATSIPGARFLPLESRNHVILEQEPAWPRFIDEVHSFLRADKV